jgi:hypothetical protein
MVEETQGKLDRKPIGMQSGSFQAFPYLFND